MNNVHLEEFLNPVRIRNGGLTLHPSAHGGDVTHAQLIPPGTTQRMVRKLGEDVNQAFVQVQNALGNGNAQGNARYSFG